MSPLRARPLPSCALLSLPLSLTALSCDEGGPPPLPPASGVGQADPSAGSPSPGAEAAGVAPGAGGGLIGGDAAGVSHGGDAHTAGVSAGVTGSPTGGRGGADPLTCDEGVACGASCVLTDQDPANCGGCGRTCVIPNATARCVSGQCQVASCDLGYQDQDGALDNGCELESDCLAGEACVTECGSEGLSWCEEGEARCQLPEERCNLIDDDCDGSCDEGWQALGCRTPIHRGYGNGYHIYSDNLEQVSQNGRVEAQNYFYLSSVELPNSRPVFFCRSAMNRPFLSTLTNCGVPRAPEATLGFWLAEPACGAEPLYHAVSPNQGSFFYTTSADELDSAISLGFQNQGIVGYIWRP